MKGMRPIYMDHHATTPVDPRVLDEMLPYFSERFGNPASTTHVYGREAKAAVKHARERAAAAIGARPVEVIFTSGATEAINLAIKGAAAVRGGPGARLVTCVTEHPAVLDAARWLEERGGDVVRLGVDRDGHIDLDELAEAIDERTFLVALMAANNEIGTLHPIEKIGRICRERGVWFLCDATQAVGKVPIDVEECAIDLMAWSAHKIYGPKGVGALYVRLEHPHVRLEPLLHGGGHERGLRSGTLNVPGIVGLGAATELAVRLREEEAARLRRLRDRLLRHLLSHLEEVTVHGSLEERLPGNLNVSFAGVDGEALLADLREVALSSGSACHSQRLEPSHVLRAIGVPDELCQSAVRFGLGRSNTEAEVDFVARRVVEAVTRLREMSPLWELRRDAASGGGYPSSVGRGAAAKDPTGSAGAGGSDGARGPQARRPPEEPPGGSSR